MNKTVLITGATGMVGSEALAELVKNDTVGKVISIGRRKTGIPHKKLIEIVHENFLDFSGLADDLKEIDVCIYCLAVYQNQVSKEEYVQITCDYQKALTDVLQKSSPNARFVLFGAMGADDTEKSRVLFARVKGRAENLLHQTKFPAKYIFRPGHIEPTGDRKPPGLAYRLMLPIMSVLFRLFPAIGISARDLGRAMVEVGLNSSSESRIFESNAIKQALKY